MDHPDNETIRMKVFQKGQVVIPVSLRKKYHIEVGDHVDVVEAPEGILLKPVRQKGSAAMSDELFGLFAKYAQNKGRLTKRQINQATEKGFAEGWT
jgi:AbrB family looped-hinge helix DNA binding protein